MFVKVISPVFIFKVKGTRSKHTEASMITSKYLKRYISASNDCVYLYILVWLEKTGKAKNKKLAMAEEAGNKQG